LILLQHPAAEEGLEKALFRFARRGLNDARCHTSVLVPRHDVLNSGVALHVLDRGCAYWSLGT